MLSNDDGASLTDIALRCGFSSSSDFSRSFRGHYGVPPSVFDVERFRRERRDRMCDALAPDDTGRLARLPPGDNADRFVAEDQSRLHRVLAANDVHIGTADRRRRDANHGFARPRRGPWNLLDVDSILAFEKHRLDRPQVELRMPPLPISESQILLRVSFRIHQGRHDHELPRAEPPLRHPHPQQ